MQIISFFTSLFLITFCKNNTPNPKATKAVITLIFAHKINKNEYNIKTIHQEIDEFIISDIEGLMVEIATNFEKEYIKLKCSGIWIDSVERKLTHQRKRV